MRTIIAGSRGIHDYDLVTRVIEDAIGVGFNITMVVSGGAPGVDALGERYAREHGLPIITYKADWSRYGKAAGPIRNALMAEKSEALILVWDGHSSGSADMLRKAQARGLWIFQSRVGR